MSPTYELSVYFVSYYNKTGNLLFIISSHVPKITMLNLYDIFIREKSILPIELLPKENKISLVKECRDTGLEFTNKTLINSAKILHTIKFINANS